MKNSKLKAVNLLRKVFLNSRYFHSNTYGGVYCSSHFFLTNSPIDQFYLRQAKSLGLPGTKSYKNRAILLKMGLFYLSSVAGTASENNAHSNLPTQNQKIILPIDIGI